MDNNHRHTGLGLDGPKINFKDVEGFTGDYNDLKNKPDLFSGNYNDLSNKPTLFSGDYDDLSNKPDFVDKITTETIGGVKTFSSIPFGPNFDPAYNNELVRKKYVDDNKFSGDYNDLTNKPNLANYVPKDGNYIINDTKVFNGKLKIPVGNNLY